MTKAGGALESEGQSRNETPTRPPSGLGTDVSATSVRAPRRFLTTVLVAAAILVIAGFLGADRWFYETISVRLNTPDIADDDFFQRTNLFWYICRFWSHIVGGLIAYFAILVFHPRGWRMANAQLITVGITAMTANFLQAAIARLRPNEGTSHLDFGTPFGYWTDRLHHPGVGFPSGEVTFAFALAYVLSRYFPRGAPLFFALSFLVLLARLLSGSHFLSDVAAGVALGVVGGHFVLNGCLALFARRWPIQEEAATHER